ncbi:MAG: hypothetical protein DWP94_00330 [Flavobacterium sp.]|nr:MAG: hypothetical protein DWP94_00330 [Flavobacterium sp.]
MMEEKKDIGTYFKENLATMQQQVPEALWERIDTTLDAKNRRKRRFFWLLFGTVGIIMVGVVYFWYFGRTTRNIQPYQIIEIDTNPSVETEDKGINPSKKTVAFPKTDSIDETNTSEEQIKKNNPGQSEVKKKSDTYLDSFTESKTTYYYYRSSDEQKIITTDKSKVDSLIEEHKRSVIKKDSIQYEVPLKKKDSLK